MVSFFLNIVVDVVLPHFLKSDINDEISKVFSIIIIFLFLDNLKVRIIIIRPKVKINQK